jgi:hypothetical protein
MVAAIVGIHRHMLLVGKKIFKKRMSERGPRIKTMRKDLGKMKLKV